MRAEEVGKSPRLDLEHEAVELIERCETQESGPIAAGERLADAWPSPGPWHPGERPA